MTIDASLNDLFTIPVIHRFHVSPGGDRIAVIHDATGRPEIHLIDVHSGELTRLSSGDIGRQEPGPLHWAPDGKSLYFQRSSDNESVHSIVQITLDGAVETVLTVDGRIHLEDVGPDDRYLLFMNHSEYDEPYHRDLYRYDRATQSHTKLTDYENPVHRVTFSPSGDRVAYNVYEFIGEQEGCTAYIAQNDGRHPHQLEFGESESVSRVVGWHPDGIRLLVSDDSTGTIQPGIYSVTSGEIIWYGTVNWEVRPLAFHPDGQRFLARHYREVTTTPAVYSLDGDVEELAVSEGVTGIPPVVPPYGDIFLKSGNVVLLTETEAQPPILIEYDFESQQTKTILDPMDGKVDSECLVDAEYITYEAPDGVEIGALLYRPKQTPAPAVVHVHGGPSARMERRFEMNGQYAQFFVNCGYSVLQPNYRGSTGRGADFQQLIRGEWGHGDAMDIAAGGRWMHAKDWVDDSRLAVFGQSYGAYSVLVQMAKYPMLWACGIAWNGPVDGFGDGSYNPLANVENVDRPLLLLAGENDQSLDGMYEFYDAATENQNNGTDWVHLIELTTEGHHSRDTDHHIRRFSRVQGFLDSYL